VLGAVALAALALEQRPGAPPPPPPALSPGESPRAGTAPSAARPVDPAAIRDLFRFADERAPVAGSMSEAVRRWGDAPLPTSAPSGPRLVGLVRRAGRLVAALAADGEVVLAGPGETAAGVTVLSVDDEGVRVRRADGSEETLALP
jgi:hypothetical protein